MNGVGGMMMAVRMVGAQATFISFLLRCCIDDGGAVGGRGFGGGAGTDGARSDWSVRGDHEGDSAGHSAAAWVVEIELLVAEGVMLAVDEVLLVFVVVKVMRFGW